ncbi:MAG TPA: hypothetical protein VNT50_10755 [Microbacterium sp.]|uniref:hypothetical protein n=1 Tax=Microbacterium sp. TaxID=51671 RepID=UPI002BC60A14|nr:hypothetical protein [Microbacterium sp.]HWI31962.1 hypothetical protein [Microbacterium sp.]
MRRLLVLAGIGVVAAVLAGCAGGATGIPTGGSTGDAIPSAEPRASKSPGGPTSLTAWAESALPRNKPGGSKAVIREAGAVTAETGHRAEIGQDAGAWTVQIACESAAGTPIAYRLMGGSEEIARGEVACGARGERGAGNTRVDFAGGTETRLELSAEADAIFVYEVTPGAAIQN